MDGTHNPINSASCLFPLNQVYSATTKDKKAKSSMMMSTLLKYFISHISVINYKTWCLNTVVDKRFSLL